MTDDLVKRLTSDEVFAIFKGSMPMPVAAYLLNGGAKLDRSAFEMIQAVREQATSDRIEALTAENERLRGLFVALAIDPDACAVARQYARAALGDTQC